MRTRAIALTVGAATIVATSLLPGPAEAKAASAVSPASRTPTLRVVGYGAIQHPHAQTSSSSYRNPNTGGCSTLIADGDGSAPGPLLVEPGTEKLRIALHTAQKPKHHSVAVYAEPLIDHPGQKPVHPGSQLVKVDNQFGHPIWQLRTTLQLGAGQAAYLSVHLSWKNNCEGTDTSSWTFHVQAAS